MPTIGNLPNTDINVQFESGEIKTVNLLRLLVQVQNAEFKRDHGMFLPGVNKLHPTLKALRDEYEISPQVRTWEHMAGVLRQFYTDLSEFAKTR
jgi:hypothetical protein